MSDEQKQNAIDLLCEAIRIGMPDLRHYYRMPKKAKVVGVYASEGGKYYADVQPLRNDESVDPNEPVVQKVEIPILWGGPNRGVVCPPVVGVHCDLGYYDGDPNYPHINNFRWHDMNAPAAELNEFVIQLEPGVEIRIDKLKQIVFLTPENVNTKAGKNWTVVAGDNATVQAGKEVTLQAGSVANIVAPIINFLGRIFFKPANGSSEGYAEFSGNVIIRGNQTVDGNHTTSGNSYAGTRSGGSCPH